MGSHTGTSSLNGEISIYRTVIVSIKGRPGGRWKCSRLSLSALSLCVFLQ
jgi:hypothetical protein